jgi:integrase
MLPDATLPVPASLAGMLACFVPLFTAPSFRAFTVLACGFLAQTEKRTVCGMLAGVGLARLRPHDRAHFFFARDRWNPDELGLAAAKLVVALLVALLRLAIRRAERDGKMGRNVAALADPPGGMRRKSRAMTLAQVSTLLAAKLNTFWRGYITVGLTCGLRPGELLGLRWEDVDFDRGVIRVRKCLKALPDPKTGKRHLVLEDLKTEQSPRTMLMPRLAAAALRELRKDQARWKLKIGAA